MVEFLLGAFGVAGAAMQLGQTAESVDLEHGLAALPGRSFGGVDVVPGAGQVAAAHACGGEGEPGGDLVLGAELGGDRDGAFGGDDRLVVVTVESVDLCQARSASWPAGCDTECQEQNVILKPWQGAQSNDTAWLLIRSGTSR
ncbi:hypothetical protein [Nonomuraea sp. SYSU D8015]|uniref:hypothetical protein n=1 Tax=Nonomuraea sp. SYSU D8015 TaxID=2593644 RepID=UPI001661847F|nr:hypothetical protein [Nonomuraea sp. SYSU D8015]